MDEDEDENAAPFKAWESILELLNFVGRLAVSRRRRRQPAGMLAASLIEGVLAKRSGGPLVDDRCVMFVTVALTGWAFLVIWGQKHIISPLLQPLSS